jgi:MGT family glycosyltransferase
MSRFLFVTWDGAGNLGPTLGLAQRLARAGHDVRVLGDRSIDERCGAHGWRFRPWSHIAAKTAASHDPARAPAYDPQAEMRATAGGLWFSEAVSREVRDELGTEAADVLVGDCMLFGALCAGQAAGVPTVALFHGAFAPFRGGPLADLLNAHTAGLNRVRCELALSEVERISDVHDQCALSVVATPREFDPPLPLPPNVRFAGPILDGPPLTSRLDDIDIPGGPGPLVVISFSTSEQGQLPLLRRIAGALTRMAVRAILTAGPAVPVHALPDAGDVRVTGFTPHAAILPHASLVVTHAGLGTVMAALSHGVPVLAVPLGRDQFFNAARVEALGAGAVLSREADEPSIAAAVERLLENDAVRTSARRFADVIATYRNGAPAVAELERLAASS